MLHRVSLSVMWNEFGEKRHLEKTMRASGRAQVADSKRAWWPGETGATLWDLTSLDMSWPFWTFLDHYCTLKDGVIAIQCLGGHFGVLSHAKAVKCDRKEGSRCSRQVATNAGWLVGPEKRLKFRSHRNISKCPMRSMRSPPDATGSFCRSLWVWQRTPQHGLGQSCLIHWYL